MASMVHKLQRTYQEGWLSSDQDGDGQVSASELMHKYDLDGDGTIDAKELANISATASTWCPRRAIWAASSSRCVCSGLY